MRNWIPRAGKVAIQTIIVGAATLIGGAASVPLMMQTGTKSSAPTASARHEMTMLPLQETQAESPSSETVQEKTTTDPSRLAMGESKKALSSDAKEIERVQVFYATDRQWFQASNPHLWITALAPTVLCIMITCLLIAGCFSGARRWAWGLATCVGIVVSCIMGGQSAIKVSRLMRLANEGSSWYGTGRFETANSYPLHLGTCVVSLPPNHRAGMIEAPSVFTLDFEEQEDRHIVVHRIERLEFKQFFSELSNRIAVSEDRSALVYIHGYNVEFDEALQRTAQLSKDIHFTGAPILYSWPSNGSLLKYRLDESDVEWSVAHLERFLADVHRTTGVKQLHVIAHSMGNRALVGALQLLWLRYPEQQPMLGQVILAAPDIDADVFRDRYADAVKAVSRRATLYASANDRALLASLQLHGHRRLGLTRSPQPTVTGVDLVDVTPVDTSLLGHSYYGSHPLMILELMSLVQKGSPPEERSWLTTLADSRIPPLWRFVPEFAAKAMINYR